MFDDQGSNQNDENQMNGVSDAAVSDSGHGTGAITDPSDNAQGASEPTLVHPSSPPPQDDNQSSDDNSTQDNSQEPSDAPVPDMGGSTAPASDNSASNAVSSLDQIKKQALEELSPLVGKLDQEPEDKYKTLMMMIQASDNQDLLKDAYETAQKITDEKARAEALLNIVNEINYFTQNN